MMFCAQLEAVIEAAPRLALQDVAATIWRAYAAGTLSADEAQRLAEKVELRKAPPSHKEARGRARDRRRDPPDLRKQRRRVMGGRGYLPDTLKGRFTQGEHAVLACVAAETLRTGGECRLSIGALVDRSGCCATLVKRALRIAEAMGLIRIVRRRRAGWRNDVNRISITSTVWLAWLKRWGGGTKVSPERKQGKNLYGIRILEQADSATRAPRPMRYGQGADWNSGRGRRP